MLYLQFGCSSFHSACSICSSGAPVSIPRALFAVRTLYFHFRALYLQFACSTFSFARSICSSYALISIPRALFAVRTLYFLFCVLYFQFVCSIFSFTWSICSSRAPFAARMLWFPFHVLQLQLARFNILAFCFTAPALDRAIRALMFLHVILCCGLCMWHMNKALRLKWLQHG